MTLKIAIKMVLNPQITWGLCTYWSDNNTFLNQSKELIHSG